MRSSFGAPLLAVVALSGCGSSTSEQANKANRGDSAQTAACYDEAGEDFSQPRSDKALFVVIDQSTGLDENLRENVTNNVERLLKPGTTYAVYTFSAYSKGHYPTEITSGELPAPVADDDRPALSVRRLHRLDLCLEKQSDRAKNDVDRALDKATGEASSEFANSEVMASLNQVSEAVRQSNAKQKLVIVVSDMLEHSSATSFYRNKTLRPIDADAELQKAKKANLTADFDGADVAIVGAGLLSPESGEGKTRDTAALHSLQEFWKGWFGASNADVIEYGQPDLISPLRWGNHKD
jgi:hypothetical protein